MRLDVRENSLVSCACLMDGKRTDLGYRYLITVGATSHCAYRSPTGLLAFMKRYGMTVDKATVSMHDNRKSDKGRVLCFSFHHPVVQSHGFYHLNEIPDGATCYIDLCNGEYVNHYVYVADDGTRHIYWPNPNSKEVYIPYDYNYCRENFS